MHIGVHIEKLFRFIQVVEHQAAIPGPVRHIGDGVVVATEEAPLGEVAIQHIQLTLHFHGETVDRVLEFLRRIGIKMAKTATQVRHTAHLPEQPGKTFRARAGVFRQELAEFFRQIEQYRAGLEHPRGRVGTAIQQCGNLGVGVDLDKAGTELIALKDVDQPGIIFRALVTQCQQLLQQHRHFHTVRRGEGVELQRVLTPRQCVVVRGTGDGPIDIGKPTTIAGLPGPYFGWHILV